MVGRPGNPLPTVLPPALAARVAGGRWCVDPARLHEHPAGCLYPLPLPLRDGSATAVRAAVSAAEPIDGLVPAAVADYIHTHKLYRFHAG